MGIGLELDEIDLRLLDLLQHNADRTLRELGDEVGLSPSAVQRRYTRYKASGLVRLVAIVDTKIVTSLTQAIVLLALVEESLEHHAQLAEMLRGRPEVQQCYALSGRWDYAVLVSAPTVAALRDFSNKVFKVDDNIRRYDTLFIFDTVKAGSTIPMDLFDHRDT